MFSSCCVGCWRKTLKNSISVRSREYSMAFKSWVISSGKNSKEWTKNTAGGEGNMITVSNWNNKETRVFFFFLGSCRTSLVSIAGEKLTWHFRASSERKGPSGECLENSGVVSSDSLSTVKTETLSIWRHMFWRTTCKSQACSVELMPQLDLDILVSTAVSSGTRKTGFPLGLTPYGSVCSCLKRCNH